MTPGGNLARTITRLQAGQSLKFTIIGDSIADNTTPGNAGGGPLEKTVAILNSRFGVTSTSTNHAESGYTTALAHINGKVAAAIADRPDVFLVCLGKNDIGSDINGAYAPGYPREAGMAALERLCAVLRRDVPNADIIILGEGPYVVGTSSNTALRVWSNAAKRVAAQWGAEFIDVQTAFEDLGDWDALMYDSTHQNAAGNDLYAVTIAEHFPADFEGVTVTPLSGAGIYGTDRVNTTTENLGYVSRNSTGTSDGLTVLMAGPGWVGNASSAAGAYVKASGDVTELLMQVSTAVADAAVVDVYVDNVRQVANLDLSAQGKKGNYWVPFATGLTPGEHTLQLNLKSGTLRFHAAAGVLSASPTASSETCLIELGFTTSVAALPTDGSYLTLVSETIELPPRWKSAIVQVIGTAGARVLSSTSVRDIQLDVRINGSGTLAPVTSFPPTPVALVNPLTSALVTTITGDAPLLVRQRVTSADKTNCQNAGYAVRALLTRTS